MAKFLVIALDKATQQQRNAITTFVDSKPWGYWHWFQDLWLLPKRGVPGNMTATSLYNQPEKVPALKKASIVVLTFDGEPDYFGRAHPDAWDWLEKNGVKS